MHSKGARYPPYLVLIGFYLVWVGGSRGAWVVGWGGVVVGPQG